MAAEPAELLGLAAEPAELLGSSAWSSKPRSLNTVVKRLKPSGHSDAASVAVVHALHPVECSDIAFIAVWKASASSSRETIRLSGAPSEVAAMVTMIVVSSTIWASSHFWIPFSQEVRSASPTIQELIMVTVSGGTGREDRRSQPRK